MECKPIVKTVNMVKSVNYIKAAISTGGPLKTALDLQKKIKEFTPERILRVDPKIIRNLEKLLQHEKLQLNVVMNASVACGALLGWVHAVIQTNNALLVVEPKKKELA